MLAKKTRDAHAFAALPNGGLLVLPPAPVAASRDAIFRLATQHRMPAVYAGDRLLAAAGGLMTYGSDFRDRDQRAAIYVDRHLRGARVADLPVQFPIKYDLVINLKTARALGLTIPASILARADEVIE